MIDFASIVPTKRSAEDIFAGRIRVELGDRTYIMPVRSRKGDREWLSSLDGWFTGRLRALETIDDPETALKLMFSATETFLDALVAYDETGALPSREEIDEQASNVDIIRAVMEVWRAANPLVAIGLGLAPSPETPPPAPSPSRPGRTAGLRELSRTT